MLVQCLHQFTSTSSLFGTHFQPHVEASVWLGIGFSQRGRWTSRCVLRGETRTVQGNERRSPLKLFEADNLVCHCPFFTLAQGVGRSVPEARLGDSFHLATVVLWFADSNWHCRGRSPAILRSRA